jgi:hypothetical protein
MMTRVTKYCYHLTPYSTAVKIIDCGYIDPSFSQGKSQVCWYVSSRKVAWAIAHVCQRHQCQIEDIAVLTVITPRDVMRQSNRQGVYFTNYKVRIAEMTSASIWLQREERYVFIPGRRTRRADWKVHEPE